MPCRSDIKSIFILGSGPIIIGQACEFDYSGTQACKVLRKEGFRIILLNSNPATIMTDPEMADATYIEPLTLEIAEKIIAREKPEALLPTVGGQTALNLSMELDKSGVLKRYNVELLGASIESIQRSESRQEFKAAMESIGLSVPTSKLCHSMEEAENFLKGRALPLIIRSSFTLGGTGGGIARSPSEFMEISQNALRASPMREILIEESLIGWKEFELELMRDLADNVVVICSIENLDPMGVHTGDSITVAPQQSLSDRQYQKMRNAALKIIRKIGVATGGSNIQFAVNPKNGDMIVIEMNPRVSRSSALASKATGFPIAKIAAQLAVGYTLDELRNEITQVTPCSFEPSIDYVVTKVPRFSFEKFPESEDTLGTMMRSVGETMSLGRTFKESLQKALRSLEISRYGLGSDGALQELFSRYKAMRKDRSLYFKNLEERLERPNPQRIFAVKEALEWGWRERNRQENNQDSKAKEKSRFSVEDIYKLSKIDPWFLYQILALVEIEVEYKKEPWSLVKIQELKQCGYSDHQLAFLMKEAEILGLVAKEELPEYIRRAKILEILKETEKSIYEHRKEKNLFPVYKCVDTCGGEFQAHTPYLYSTYEEETEARVTKNKKVIILGGGPNRIGQGIEFDYCCCHASFALKEMGIEAIMVNSNPETVSTDYDTSSKLYFEPLTLEDILHICHFEKPEGVIVTFGGQTPLSLAKNLAQAGIKILGSSWDAIDRAENRDSFSKLLEKLGLEQAPCGLAYTLSEAKEIVKRISFPVLMRPSYVLGGRAMVIVYEDRELEGFMEEAASISPEHPVLIDRFLENAVEIDVDALSDGEEVFVAGIMQHIEEAGIHSGDSACILPALDLSPQIIEEIKEAVCKIALELGVIGLLNIQFAAHKKRLFVIEVNPRASRTVPFVSKSIGLPLAKLATQLMCGKKLAEMRSLRLEEKAQSPPCIAVKEAILPFARFPGSDIVLGPEMKSTGEVMGLASSLGQAYIKAQLATGEKLPQKGGIFFSISDEVKEALSKEARTLTELGFTLYSTQGTADFLKKKGIAVELVHKMRDRSSPNPLELLREKKIQALINIPHSRNTRDDALMIRQEAVRHKILCITTSAGTKAFVCGLKEMQSQPLELAPLQKIHSAFNA